MQNLIFNYNNQGVGRVFPFWETSLLGCLAGSTLHPKYFLQNAKQQKQNQQKSS